ncbi:MAG: sigma-70 family RNA polymerase sigma factor [Pseudonocardiaceae bacterium]
MLGSLDDADEALQDVLLRAWRALAGFQGRSSLRSWLYRIATNVCLDLIRKRPKRVLPLDHGPAAGPHQMSGEPLVESVWIEPYPDSVLGLDDGRLAPEARYEQRESVELAFVAAIQHLPGNERAALLLREVIGFSAREVAELMEATVPAVNSALQRARRLVDERVPKDSQQATLRSLGDPRLREIVDGYTNALEQGDLDALVGMLTEDATWSMPPIPDWYRGSEAITAFLVAGPLRVRWRHVPTRANGQAAVGCYAWDAQRGCYVATVLDVLTLRGERIAAVTAFIDREVFARFGLPAELPA